MYVSNRTKVIAGVATVAIAASIASLVKDHLDEKECIECCMADGIVVPDADAPAAE